VLVRLDDLQLMMNGLGGFGEALGQKDGQATAPWQSVSRVVVMCLPRKSSGKA
jgi:hypothetical protein